MLWEAREELRAQFVRDLFHKISCRLRYTICAIDNPLQRSSRDVRSGGILRRMTL
jgi:hypothetical protein